MGQECLTRNLSRIIDIHTMYWRRVVGRGQMTLTSALSYYLRAENRMSLAGQKD